MAFQLAVLSPVRPREPQRTVSVTSFGTLSTRNFDGTLPEHVLVAEAQAKPRAPATLPRARPARACLPPRRVANPDRDVEWAKVTIFAAVDEDGGVPRDTVRVAMGVEKAPLWQAHLRLRQHEKIVARARRETFSKLLDRKYATCFPQYAARTADDLATGSQSCGRKAFLKRCKSS